MAKQNKDEVIRIRLDVNLKKLLKKNVADISKYVRQLIIDDFKENDIIK